jgi:hypothetical protein
MHVSTIACRLAVHPLKAVFVLALLVRLINLAFLAGNDSFFAEQDAFAYWALGAGLARPESFWPTLVAETDRMPLYPLVLGGIERVFGDAPRMAAILQAVVDAGTCALIAALGALVSPRVGLIAGILAAFSATLIVFSTQILTETVFLFFFTLMLLAGGCFLRHPSNGLAALAGLAGGLALATRPALAPLLAAGIPLVFVAALVQRRGFAAASVATLLFAVGSAAPVAPVWLRNVIHYGSFSLTAQAGHHLAYWIVPLVTQRADGTPYQTTVDRMETLYRQRAQTLLCAPRKLDCAAEGDLNAQTNPFARAAVKSDLAREAMARLPLAAYAKAWLEGMAVNLGAPALLIDPRVRALPKPSFYNTPGVSLWEKTHAYLFDDPGAYQALLVVGLVAMLPILILETVGFVMLARASPWGAAFAGGVLAYFLLLNGPVATPKYRLPMEPVLLVLAAIPLARMTERRRPRAPAT